MTHEDTVGRILGALNPHTLDFIEAHLVVAPIVKLSRSRGTVVRHGRRDFERAAVLQIDGDAGRAETVVSYLGRDARPARAGRSSHNLPRSF